MGYGMYQEPIIRWFNYSTVLYFIEYIQTVHSIDIGYFKYYEWSSPTAENPNYFWQPYPAAQYVPMSIKE